MHHCSFKMSAIFVTLFPLFKVKRRCCEQSVDAAAPRSFFLTLKCPVILAILYLGTANSWCGVSLASCPGL